MHPNFVAQEKQLTDQSVDTLSRYSQHASSAPGNPMAAADHRSRETPQYLVPESVEPNGAAKGKDKVKGKMKKKLVRMLEAYSKQVESL